MASTMTTHLLRPAKPFDLEFPLSIVDALNPPINSRSVFIYKAPEDPSSDWQEDLVDRLGRSLEIFLRKPEDAEEGIIAIPKLLATVVPDPVTGKLSARITKDSAVRLVVRHEPGFSYEQLHPEHQFPTRHVNGDIFSTIAEGMPPLGENGGWEGFALQLTFIKGGFLLLVSKHHYLVDGMSTGKLMKWWFARARGLMAEKTALGPERVEPEFSRGVIDDATLLKEDKCKPMEHMEWKIVPGARTAVFGTILPPPWVMYLVSYVRAYIKPAVTSRVFHFPPSSLRALSKDIAQHTTERFSTHDAVCALAWRCVTRARFFTTKRTHLLPEKSMLALSVNVRHRLSPPLANQYFGNAAMFGPSQLPAATLNDTGPTTLGEIALSIRDAINTKTGDEYIRSLTQLTLQQPRVGDVVNNFRVYRGYDVVVTSWMGMFDKVEDLDLGVGRFKRMRQPGGASFDGIGVVMPMYGMRAVEDEVAEVGDYPGGLEMGIDLLNTHMEFLMKDEEWNTYARYTEGDGGS